jgi:GTPase
MNFRAGFVSIIGKPNAGKSTLLNALVAEKISIVTAKAQTTRQRIRGIITTGNYQIVFSDTPGIIEPKYELHRSMMKSISEAVEDADLILLLFDPTSSAFETGQLLQFTLPSKIPCLAVINKIDIATPAQIQTLIEKIEPRWPVSLVSSLQKIGLQNLVEKLIELLPEHEPYFQSDELTDKSERFLVSELIREKIFEQFQQEIPYSTQVIVTEWKDDEVMLRIRSEVIVERESQKGILLGKNGQAIKSLGIAARESLEEYFRRKVFLGLTVKVNPDWRNDMRSLKYFGYEK